MHDSSYVTYFTLFKAFLFDHQYNAIERSDEKCLTCINPPLESPCIANSNTTLTIWFTISTAFQVTAQACALHLFSLHSLSLSHQLSTPYPSHPDLRHPVPSAFDMPLGRHIEYDCSTRSHNPIWPSGIRHGPRPPNNKNMGFSGHACISYNRWHCLRGRVLGPGP